MTRATLGGMHQIISEAPGSGIGGGIGRGAAASAGPPNRSVRVSISAPSI
jgi:hypothetical protein